MVYWAMFITGLATLSGNWFAVAVGVCWALTELELRLAQRRGTGQ